jgi:hypothetical protein
MRFTLERRQIALALAVVWAAACHSSKEVPEPGALLLDVKLAPGAQTPDELRLFVYDDSGALWNDVRVPAEGPLVPRSATDLGTILVQPGVTAGDLRFDLRGLSSGVLVDEGTLKIPGASASGGTFDVTLASALPADSDGDGVPDPVDDCPAVPDPKQAGCAPDGGGADASSHRDAAVDVRQDASLGHPDASRMDAGRMDASRMDASRADAGPVDAGRDMSLKAKGVVCGAAGECASGFCKDGVCCNTACTDACNSCQTGTCTAVKSGVDAPECIAPMSCNNKGKCVGAGATGT